MKNKSVTYLLIGVVVLIWGLVVYRIFSAVSEGESGSSPIATFKSEKKAKVVQDDTFELILDYRDPFLGKISVASFLEGEVQQTRKTQKKQSFSAPIAPTSAIDWSFVTYLGAINSKKPGKEIGMFRLHGNEVMMKVKESRGEITVLKITKDSAYIQYQGIKKGLIKFY